MRTAAVVIGALIAGFGLVGACGGSSTPSTEPDDASSSSSGSSSGGGSGSSSGSSSSGGSGGSSSGSSSGGKGSSSSGGKSGSSSGSGSGSGSSSGADAGFACESPADCKGGDVCCAKIPVDAKDAGSIPNCNTGNPVVACTTNAACTSNVSISACQNEVVQLCEKASDCAGAAGGYNQCCTFGNGSGSLTFCATSIIALGGTCK